MNLFFVESFGLKRYPFDYFLLISTSLLQNKFLGKIEHASEATWFLLFEHEKTQMSDKLSKNVI